MRTTPATPTLDRAARVAPYGGTVRAELVDLVARLDPRPTRILSVGVGHAGTEAAIKERTGAHVVGIEVDPESAAAAAPRLDRLMVGDIEPLPSLGEPGEFDLVLCADVLEHLRDPGAVLAKIRRALCEGGRLIVSVPNARNWFLFHMVFVRGDFQYRERGLFDRTHLRFFTRKSLWRLLTETGYEVERTMAVMQAHAATRLRRVFVRCANFLLPREFSAFQWLVIARPASNDGKG